MTQQARIIEFEPHHLLSLTVQKEQRYFLDKFNTSMNIINYGVMIKDNAAEADDNTKCAWTAIANDKVVGCAGILKLQEHAGEAWSLLSDEFRIHARILIPAIKKQISLTKLMRIHALIDVGFTRAERFIKAMGFEYEGTLRCSGVNKQDQKIYSRIRK